MILYVSFNAIENNSVLEGKGKLQEEEDNRVAQEGNGEGTGNQLPCNRSQDGGGNSTQETQVEELLDTIRDTEDILSSSRDNIQGGHTGNHEETKGDSHLTTTHKSGKILSTVLEKAVASLEGHGGGTTFRLRKLGDSEECNLHTLKKTNTGHQHKEEDQSNNGWKSFPRGRLALSMALLRRRKPRLQL